MAKATFTEKDADVVEKALAKLGEHAWVVSVFDEGSGLAVELSGARWQITDPTAKNDDIAIAAAEYLVARQPKDM